MTTWLQNQPKVRFVQKRLRNLDELIHEEYDFVINCTGVGARFLVNDTNIRPISGHVLSKWSPLLITTQAESFYDVKYWNINYYVKCSSENCWFLVRCFFSVIWNISQINVSKTKCKSKCQNDFFGKLFLKSGNTSVHILCFHYWHLSDEHLTW